MSGQVITHGSGGLEEAYRNRTEAKLAEIRASLDNALANMEEIKAVLAKLLAMLSVPTPPPEPHELKPAPAKKKSA